MNKETTIAVILGIAAGIAIALFVIFGSKANGDQSSQVINEGISPTVVIKESEADITKLVINEPKNEFVSDTDSITLKGATAPNSLIVVQSPSGENTFKNEKVDFTSDVTLSQGENVIRVTSYSGKNIESKTVTIYYIKE